MEAIETTLDAALPEAEAAVRQALSEQGFGILTEIDVAATLAAKLGVERPPLQILGACNPTLAHRALRIDPSLALLLPCNVVLEATDDGRTRVSIADPRALLTAGATPPPAELEALAAEAGAALDGARRRLEG